MNEMKRLPYARKQQILQRVMENGCVTMEHLAKDFDVSYMTIYRDVQALEKEGNVCRVYGGIKAAKTPDSQMPPKDDRILRPYGDAVIEERFLRQYEAKKSIARAAAGFVEDGDLIAMDASTTTLHMCPFLQERRIMVVTTSLSVALQFSVSPTVTVILCGGVMGRYSLSTVGQFLPGVLQKLCVNKCFLSSNGFTAENGVTDMSLEECDAKRQLMAASQQTYVLMDHTKLDRRAPFVVCRAKEMRALLTDGVARRTPNAYREVERCRELGCEAIVAD